MKALLKVILYKPLYNLLVGLIFISPGHQLWLAVIILTVLIRVALLPLTRSITRQQALISKLKPELDALQAKYKGDKMRLSQEMMAFYKRHRVNPYGSCLPMILQLVILVVLYRVFQVGVDKIRLDLIYGFMPKPEQVNPYFFGINLSLPDLFVLPIIAGSLQFIQTWQMMPKSQSKTGDPSAAVQKQILYIFPVMTVVIARQFPAGLPLYWSVSSVISIIQQHYILKQTEKMSFKQADEILEGGVDPTDSKTIEEKTRRKGVEITVRQKR